MRPDSCRGVTRYSRGALETKYLHLRQPVSLGHRVDDWRVCWLGGWDKQHVFFVVMLVRVRP
jgi:hypothetical protein